MNRITATAAIATLAIGASTGLATAGHSRTNQTLQLTAEFTQATMLDLGKKGPSIGDEQVASGRLLDSAGRQAGRFGFTCTWVAAASRLLPDLVLLDIQLPDTDGFAVARSIAETRHPAPVVLTSTREASDYGDRIAESSAIAFLPKTDLSGRALRKLMGRR